MEGAVLPPVVPARTSLRPRHARHRRRSLPPSSPGAARHDSANRVNVQPASPEVISSLLSSLSAISSPAENHFNSFPTIASSYSTPSSPKHHQTGFSGIHKQGGWPHGLDPSHDTGGGFGMDYGAYHNPNNLRENYFLHPDDAAIPPIVRTARPPSGLSSITAPQKPASLKSRMRPTSIGSQSTGSKENEDMVSVGTLSIEPGVAPARSSASIHSAGSGGRNFLKNRKGLLYMGSKERLRETEKEKERKRNILDLGCGTGGLGIDIGKRDRNIPAATPQNPLQHEMRVDATTAGDTFTVAHRSSLDTSLSMSDPNPRLDARKGSPGGIGSGRFIPTRNSSLRHTQTENSTHRKRRSQRASDNSSKLPKEVETEHEQPEKVTDHTDEDNVARRIRELKAQKRQREDQPALQTTDAPLNARGPVGPPLSLPPQPLNNPPQSASALASTQIERKFQVRQVQILEDENSAPSPAVVQRMKPNGGTPFNSTDSKPMDKQSPSTKTSLDVQRSPPTSLPRSNSRFKRYSRPTTPERLEAHRRTLSNPLVPQGFGTQVAEERPSSADSIDYAVDEYMSSPRLSQKIRHPQTGRVISFSEVGDPNGFAVFCCVGMGLTRYITAFYDELALTLNLRLITADRPGVGESEPYTNDIGTPLGWSDDVYAICQALKVTKFSILAHSAGAIYALATALRMPQHIRGRIHLLAPWIPPSQMSMFGSQQDSLPAGAVPYSQRILRSLPTPFLKAANSSFLSATSASITSSLPKSPRRGKRKSSGTSGRETPALNGRETPRPPMASRRDSLMYPQFQPNKPDTEAAVTPIDRKLGDAVLGTAATTLVEKERQTTYDTRLTHAIWDLATTNANPAVDLLVCLERRQTIGFRYVDINRAVVIHHGSRDTRVPVENVKWLGKLMRRCEVRILVGEGHRLMANAGVMGGVLMEVAKEWEDWMRVVHGKRG